MMIHDPQEIRQHRGGTLLVSAAAGSGKTYNMIEHILSLLSDPERPGDLRRILVATFTNAAASEMKERLKKRLSEEILSGKLSPEQTMHLRRQAGLLPHAHIGTIDSFCGFLVRSYYQELDLDPDFRIAEEGELKLLSREAMDLLMEAHYGAAEPEFIGLLDAYAEKDDARLRHLIAQLESFAASSPFPEEWLEGAMPVFPGTVEELYETPWFCEILKRLREEFAEMAGAAEKAEEATDNQSLRAMFAQDAALLSGLSAQTDSREFLTALAACRLPVKPRSSAKNPILPEEDALAKERRGLYQERLNKIKKDYSSDPADLLADLKKTEEPIRTLIALTLEYREILSRMKKEKNLVDFSDIEQLALRLTVRREEGKIVTTVLSESIRQGFDEIIIDEYQDINEVQDLLMWAVSGEPVGKPNRFMVGDVKQSIYKFRRAKPELFIEKFDRYGEEKGDYRKIGLNRNFRSRPAVLQLVNEIFTRIMDRPLGGIVYDDAAALHYPAELHTEDQITPQDDARLVPELWLTAADLPAEERRRREAENVAAEIEKLIGRPILIENAKTGKLRCVKPGDIVILLRADSEGAAPFTEALARYGIPVRAASKNGFFETQEIRTLLALIAVLDNPRQDIPLAALLLSPMFGFTDEDLVKLRIPVRRAEGASLREPGGLYECLLRAWEEDPASFGRIGYFLECLARWRRKAERLTVPVLLEEILEETGYGLFLRAMPGGAVRQANVRKLLRQAASFEKSGYRGLYQFGRYIEEQKQAKVRLGESDAAAEDDDAVRIMSIHKSKGLEFPLVILASMDRSFASPDSECGFRCQDTLGLAARTVDPERRCRSGNLWDDYVAECQKRDICGEELRLLYVALTRASQKLILSGSVRKLPESFEASGTEKVPAAALLKAGSYLDWLMLCRGIGPLSMCEKVFTAESAAETAADEYFASEVLRRKLERLKEEAAEGIRNINEEKWASLLTEKYPYEAMQDIRGIFSVSALSHGTPGKSREAYASLSVPEEGLQGAERGTYYHRVMELIPPVAAHDPEAVRLFLENMAAENCLDRQEAASVRAEDFTAFFCAPVGKRAAAAAAAGKLFREQPFVYGIPACRLYPELGEGGKGAEELLLVQGIVDMFFEEDGKFILVDYKTDRVNTAEELTERYRVQLGYYREALEAAGMTPVSETYIYSFFLRRFIPVQTALQA